MSLTLSYLLILVIIKRQFNVSLLEFFAGAVLGLVLPYLDYFVYAFVTAPKDNVSVKALGEIRQRKIISALGTLYYDSGVIKDLIFHTIYFYITLVAFTFWVVTSSGSYFGRGLALAFTFHLFVIQLSDFMNFGTLSWLTKYNISLDRERKLWYLGGNFVLLFFLGLLG